MATVYISEYSVLARDEKGMAVPVGIEPPLAEQTVAIGVAAQSAAFNAETKYIRVHTDAICSIAFGANPTATTSNKRLAANSTEYFGVKAGDKLSVIANT